MTHSRRHRFGVPLSAYVMAAVIFVIAFVAILIVVKNLVLPLDPKNGSTQQFEIAKGESVKSVAGRLQADRLVRSALGFRVAVKQSGLDGSIQAGVYQLSPAMSAHEIARALTRGLKDVRLTIPEGYRSEQIAETVSSVLGIPEKDFLAAAAGSEGYLFPDTYFLAQGSTAEDAVETLKDTFAKKTAGMAPSKEDVVLASLVERETKGDAEKPIVAGILKKRLAAGWPLQLDATVQYLAGKKGEWWPNTTLLDRERSSAYNTYLHQGLPPGPICNPGLESIKAVLSPESSEYWYYLHDREGRIHYAVTNSEHEQNIEEYIR